MPKHEKKNLLYWKQSLLGIDEETVRNYIRDQERENERYEQLSIWKD